MPTLLPAARARAPVKSPATRPPLLVKVRVGSAEPKTLDWPLVGVMVTPLARDGEVLAVAAGVVVGVAGVGVAGRWRCRRSCCSHRSASGVRLRPPAPVTDTVHGVRALPVKVTLAGQVTTVVDAALFDDLGQRRARARAEPGRAAVDGGDRVRTSGDGERRHGALRGVAGQGDGGADRGGAILERHGADAARVASSRSRSP